MKQFPILGAKSRALMESVPWEFVEQGRKRAMRNHCQTLERLAERGGLDLAELYCVVNDIAWPTGWEARHMEAASQAVLRQLDEWKAAQ